MCKTQIFISHIIVQERVSSVVSEEIMKRLLFCKSASKFAVCLTEALLLYDGEEGGHVPSVDARVQGMLGKVVRGHSLVQ